MKFWKVYWAKGEGSKSQREREQKLTGIGAKSCTKRQDAWFLGGVGIYTVSWGILGYTWESRDGYVTMMHACREHIIGY